MTIRRTFTSILCVIFIFSFVIFGQTNNSNKNDATKQLFALFDAEWENGLRSNPTFATYLGDKRYNDKWRDNSPAAFEKRNNENKAALEKLNKIDRSQLSAADQLNYDLFKKDYEQSIESYQFKQFLAPLSQQGGIQTQDDLANFLSFQTVKDYEDWLARLNALPVLMDQTLELMQAGKKENVLLPKIIMQRVPAQIDKQITATAEESPFFSAFKEFPKDIPEAEQIRLRNLAKEAISKNVIPSYKKLKVYFENEYLPASYEKVGVWQTKNGDKLYEFLARSYTTTSLTPQEIHEKGLSEVKRIRAEMEKIKTNVGFKDDMNAFFDYCRASFGSSSIRYFGAQC